MLTVYTLDKAEEWDKIVKSFKDYDTYWLSGYLKGFKLHGEGEPLLFYYEDKKTRAINATMKRDIAKSKQFRNVIKEEEWFDLSTPCGYGGWLIEGETSSNYFNEYKKWCLENNIVSEFIRFHPVIKNHELVKENYETVGLGQTITMDISSPEAIWNNITSKNRNVIRKAQKNGVKILRDSSLEIYKIFKEIYNKTMDKDNADEYYYFGDEFYQSILKDLSKNAQVFYALYDNKVIASAIMLFANGKINYHLSGSVREYSSLAASNLLLYETALWGCNNNYKTLYLGGGVGSKEDSLFKFKKAFYRGEDLNRFYIGKFIYNKNKYDEFVAMRNDLGDTGFFPKYRA